jgi:hypothetical protein
LRDTVTNDQSRMTSGCAKGGAEGTRRPHS